jgi:hypothetical protein
MGSEATALRNVDRLPKTIGLNGPIGAGKDTVASYLGIYFTYEIMGFSDPVYENLYRLNPGIVVGHNKVEYLQTIVNTHGWDYAKRRYSIVRGMLRTEGTENGREIHGSDCWVKVAQRRVENSNKPRFVFRDVRFPEEVDFIRSLNGEVWRIEGRVSDEVQNLPNHISEQHVIEPDKIIVNDGTLSRLYHRVNTLLSWYLE